MIVFFYENFCYDAAFLRFTHELSIRRAELFLYEVIQAISSFQMQTFVVICCYVKQVEMNSATLLWNFLHCLETSLAFLTVCNIARKLICFINGSFRFLL